MFNIVFLLRICCSFTSIFVFRGPLVMEVAMVPQAETVIVEGAASQEKKAFVVTMVTR